MQKRARVNAGWHTALTHVTHRAIHVSCLILYSLASSALFPYSFLFFIFLFITFFFNPSADKLTFLLYAFFFLSKAIIVSFILRMFLPFNQESMSYLRKKTRKTTRDRGTNVHVKGISTSKPAGDIEL